MQTLAAGVWKALERGAPGARLIAHGGSNRMLPAWLLSALPRVAAATGGQNVDCALTGDALMYSLCRPIFVARHVPNATMIMGLDVTYSNRLYRMIVHPALRRAPLVIAISQATAEAAVAIGVRRERVAVVRLGIPPPSVHHGSRQHAAEDLRRQLGIRADQVILLTVGRLVRRKGVTWFVRHVLPHLPSSVTYLVAGEGPMADEVVRLVAELGLGNQVRLLGAVDEDDRERLLLGADMFVQPNIPVSGDMEGFGLVLLEAAMRGTTTVASGIDGIVDAVVDGRTGFLVPPGDAQAWTERISALVSSPSELPGIGARFQQASRALFSEEQMSQELLGLLSGGISA